MDYEKKYKDALDRAKEKYSACSAPALLEYIFPELKESEGERIVKCLLNYFNHVRYNGLDLKGTDVDEVIAWLEKQGEQKPIDYNEELKKCRENPLYFFDKYVSVKLKNQKPTWGKEDEKIRKELITHFRNTRCVTEEGGETIAKWIAWLEKQKNTTDKEYVFRPLAGDTIEKAAERAVELDGKVVLAFNGAYIPVGDKTKDEIVAEYRNWVKKQGKQHSHVDIDKMVDEFADTEVEGYGLPSMIEVDAYRRDIEDALEK